MNVKQMKFLITDLKHKLQQVFFAIQWNFHRTTQGHKKLCVCVRDGGVH